jgi:hypothetical protein
MIDQRGSTESTLAKQPSRTKAWIRRLVSCGPAVAVAGSHPWSLFEPWCSPFLPHATTVVVVFLVWNLAGRHWRTSGMLGLVGLLGIWSWAKALPPTAPAFAPPSEEQVISAGFANLGINPAPVLGTPTVLQDWFGDQPLDLLGVVECSSSQVEHIGSWQRWHSVHAEPDDLSANGIALFSMFPIRSIEIDRTPNARLDHLTAVVDGPTGTFQVEITHPCPPVPGSHLGFSHDFRLANSCAGRPQRNSVWRRLERAAEDIWAEYARPPFDTNLAQPTQRAATTGVDWDQD